MPAHNDGGAPTERQAWAGLLLAAVAFVGFGAIGRMLFPEGGLPLEPPWFRSSAALLDAAAALGDAGRSDQHMYVLTLDLAIPLVYGWAFFRALWCYGDRFGIAGVRWLGVAAALCDIAENACIATILSVHPDRPLAAAVALQAFAWAKWGLLAASTLGIVGAWVAMRVRGRRPAPALGG